MTADEFEAELRSALRTYFPDAETTIEVRRGVLVEAGAPPKARAL